MVTVVGPALVATSALLVVGFSSVSCGRSSADPSTPRVIVLGLDGMDHALATRLMAEGRLPGLSRLRERGGFSALGTSIPPESPVAWSDFITGQDAGVHGIFDFIHRDPATMLPYLSTSRTPDPEPPFRLGSWRFGPTSLHVAGCELPLSQGGPVLLRRGRAFWEVLGERGVPSTVVRMPADYPPSGTATHELSGMGTPDILGGYGTFSYFTTDRLAFLGKRISGGEVHRVEARDGVVDAQLVGPPGLCGTPPGNLVSPFQVYIDPDRPAALLVVGDEERVLEQGEWSDWIPVAFPVMPTQSLPAQARFFLRQVRPELELYVSPLNIDPLAPALPISTPDSFAAELARATFPFYTQGMPEDTAALTAGVFSPAEFLAQAHVAGREVLDQFPWVLSRFDRGLLFYYVGNGDQVSHMMWRAMDPAHPAYDPERDAPFADAVPGVYAEMDGLVTYALDHMGEDTLLIVMSDHGFTSWRRTFHLNAWLHQNGYLAVKDESLPAGMELLQNVDWSRTRAYGFGLSSLYVNLRGREKDGIVPPADRDRLLAGIARELEGVVDPATGQPAIARVYLRDETYVDGGGRDVGPDAVIGYSKGTRGSDPSALGEVGREVLTNNDKPWSGDHLMDPPSVPGILATSRPLKRPARNLRELNASLLAEFGVETQIPAPAEH